MKQRYVRCALFAVCAMATVATYAQLFPWSPKDDADEDAKPWTENQVQRPPYPTTQDLIRFDPGIVGDRRGYFIDPKSISVGGDGVVRYTVMIKSAGGAENVSYEGMRCATREHKVYAYGRPDRTWTEARDQQWKFIPHKTQNTLGAENSLIGVLFVDYFCPSERHPIANARLAISRFTKGVPREREGKGDD